MHVTTVDLGDGNEPTQVVCGAHNVAAGQKVIVATLGTKLYDGDSEFVIKKSKLRGVESYGMICAEDEIGVGTGHDGIMVLPADTPVGMPAATYFGLESDFLIEVDITPNRADACSHWGVARDLYAYLMRNGQPTALHRPDDAQFAVDHNELPIAVEVERPEACLRYCAVTLKGCEIKESPKWLQDKLNTIGLRPINNIVDITNYVMMAYGQRKSARRHGLNTDASFRFERGIDPDGQLYALKQAALLAKELAGGEIAMEIVDVQSPELKKHFEVELEYKYVHELIGKEIPHDLIRTILTALDMEIVAENDVQLTLRVPAYRVDVQRPCDVVEDILRIYGYNNVEIPTSLKSSLTTKNACDVSQRLQNVVSEQLIGEGFNEILNNSLTREAYYGALKTHAPEHLVHLLNPLSSDLNVMRQTLLFGGLESIAHNVNRKEGNLRFFEFGNCYIYDAEKRNAEKVLAPYSEELHLGLWLTGKRVMDSWAHANEDSSVYELKGYAMNVLARLGVPLGGLLIKEGTNDIFSKSLSVEDRNGKVCLELGLVSKALLVACDVEQEVYYADFNWSVLMKKLPKKEVSYTELSKFPAVRRDLALLLDVSVPFAEVERVARACEKKLLRKVELFDVYEGDRLPEGKKSYAVAFTLSDETKTMNDKQTEAIMSKIIKQLQQQLGAELR